MYDTSVLQRTLTSQELSEYRRRRSRREFGPLPGRRSSGLETIAISLLFGFLATGVIRAFNDDPQLGLLDPLLAWWPAQWPSFILVFLVISLSIGCWVLLNFIQRRATDRKAQIATFALANGMAYRVTDVQQLDGVRFFGSQHVSVSDAVIAQGRRFNQAGQYRWQQDRFNSSLDDDESTEQPVWSYVIWQLPAGTPAVVLAARRGPELTEALAQFRGFGDHNRVRLGRPLDEHYRGIRIGRPANPRPG